MAALTLHLLGPPEVLREGVPCRLGAKAVAVLAYLALQGRSGRREMARMLWPEASDPLNSLSAARTATVRALGEGALLADPDSLALGEGWWVDACEFARQDPQAAWPLWRGPLLDGFRLSEWEQGLGEEFEAWLYGQRDALEERRRNLALTLAAGLVRAGEVAGALPFYQVAAGQAGEPREDAARGLLLVLGALDRPEQATAVYSDLVERLADELGVEPTERTREALRLVRGGHPRACLNALTRELTGAAPAPEPAASEEEPVPLIGRDEPLRALHERLAPVLAGERPSAAVLLLGEPGEGKTRLSREYAARLARQRRPHRLLYSAASQGGAPLELFERALRDALRAEPARLETLTAAGRAALAGLLPDLAPQEAVPLPPELAPRARLEAMRTLLRDPLRPTLLILDDLQWADPPSVDLALHLLREPPEGGLALLFAARSTEDPHGSVRRLREALAREGLGLPLTLPPLAPEAVEALTFELGRDDLNAHELHRLSGGNPFFLLELLRAEPGTPPERVGHFLSARLAALDELERQVLGALAVLGDGHGLSTLRRTSGRSEAELEGALEGLRAAAWLRLEADGAHFAHDLTRQVMLHELSASRRALLHLRAARALNSRPVLAGPHYWEARDVWDDTDLAAAHAALLATGTNYALRGDPAGGLLWLDRTQEAFSDPAQRGQSLVERARVLERYGRIEASLSALDSADLLLAEGDAVQRAAAQVTRAQLLAMKLGRLDEAQAISERVLQELERREGVAASLVRSDALNVQGWVWQQKRRWPEARRSLEASLSIRRTLQDFPRMAASLSNLGLVLWRLNDAQAEAVFQQCVALCERSGDVVSSARARHNLAYLRLESGNAAEAMPLFQQAYQDQASVGNRHSMALTLVNMGAAAFTRQDYHTAHQYYQQALLDLAATEQDRPSKASLNALANLTEAALCLGDLKGAAELLEQLGQHLGSELERWENAVFALLLAADLAAVRGQADEVRRHLRRALKSAAASGDAAQQAEIAARLEGRDPPWSAWMDALTSGDPARLSGALELDLPDWRRAYLHDALARSGQPGAAAQAQAIRTRFTGRPDPFLQQLQAATAQGRHP